MVPIAPLCNVLFARNFMCASNSSFVKDNIVSNGVSGGQTFVNSPMSWATDFATPKHKKESLWSMKHAYQKRHTDAKHEPKYILQLSKFNCTIIIET